MNAAQERLNEQLQAQAQYERTRDAVTFRNAIIEIDKKYGIPNTLIINLPTASLEWPLWAKGFKMVAKPEDKGIGDTIARIIGPDNSYAFKQWFKRMFKQDCGCTGRQAQWNQMYPLK